MKYYFFTLDAQGFYVSHHEGDGFTTWKHPIVRGEKIPEFEASKFYKWLGNDEWDEFLSYPELQPPPVVIPQSITPRQARLKLLEADLLDNLEAVITTNRAWQIEWEYATEVKRDSPLIDAVAVQAGLTSEQIDQMFIEASQL